MGLPSAAQDGHTVDDQLSIDTELDTATVLISNCGDFTTDTDSHASIVDMLDWDDEFD